LLETINLSKDDGYYKNQNGNPFMVLGMPPHVAQMQKTQTKSLSLARIRQPGQDEMVFFNHPAPCRSKALAFWTKNRWRRPVPRSLQAAPEPFPFRTRGIFVALLKDLRCAVQLRPLPLGLNGAQWLDPLMDHRWINPNFASQLRHRPLTI
jgi:hypothetical protein